MTTRLPTAQEGCLLLADITGYTAYLQGTELEHAEDVLSDLLETIIAGIEPPFEVSKLEGDAVFAHMPVAEVDAAMLFDTIESTYFAFRRRLRDIVHSTTCDCNACVLIPSLDLKFLVHSGSYVVRRIARSEELTGADVVPVHRLLKGAARDVLGNDAYLVLTRAVLDVIDGDKEALGLAAHVEHLDIGDTEVFIANLEERWVSAEKRIHESVSSETADGSSSWTFAGTPRQLWSLFTEPGKRLEWQEDLTNVDESVEGRRGVGTVSHCAHGSGVSVQQVVDWQPFTTFTARDEAVGPGVAVTVTTEFKAVAEGTEVTMYFACEPKEAWPQIEPSLFPLLDRSSERLKALLA